MAGSRNYNEAEALALLAAGDEKGFQQIYDRYALNVARIGYKYLQSAALAEDLVQEVFSAVWVQREQFTRVEYFQRYLFTMCKNIALQHLKKIAKEELLNKTYASLKSQTTENNIDDYLLDQAYPALMQKAVEQLPATHKRVFELVTIDGLSHKAIAEQLNLSPQTVSNSMTLAIKSIRSHLKLF
jgi:RNA polymerase sigma-70 factor (family 1)